MSERLRESLSALMDDEADDLELGRILRAMDSGDADLAATWSRYQLVSAALQGVRGDLPLRPLQLSLDAEDDVASAEPTAAGATAAAAGTAAAATSRSEPGRHRRALGSFAVAASLTAVAVVGWQWQQGLEAGPTSGIAEANRPATPAAAVSSGAPARLLADQRALLPASQAPQGLRESQRGPSVQAASGSMQTLEDVMRQQVEAYMVRHAEHNAVHSRSGMMPFARMAAFDGPQ